MSLLKSSSLKWMWTKRRMFRSKRALKRCLHSASSRKDKGWMKWWEQMNRRYVNASTSTSEAPRRPHASRSTCTPHVTSWSTCTPHPRITSCPLSMQQFQLVFVHTRGMHISHISSKSGRIYGRIISI